MIDEELRIRIRWSDFIYYHPIRLRITNWKNAKRFHNQYLLVNSEMAYKDKLIELCVPYHRFVDQLRKLPIKEQKSIIAGNALIELEKLPISINHGMNLRVVSLSSSRKKSKDINTN